MVESQYPQILVVSLESSPPDALINLIAHKQKLAHGVWVFDTKYYTAEVKIVGFKPETKYERVEAVIYYFQSPKELLLLDDLV
jgi:hypothetical protein